MESRAKTQKKVRKKLENYKTKVGKLKKKLKKEGDEIVEEAYGLQGNDI